MSRRKEDRLSKTVNSSHCDPHWHTFLRIGATRLKAISPIRKKLRMSYFPIPLIEKGTRLPVYHTRK